MLLEFVGSTAIPVMRPLTFPPFAAAWRGAGPIAVQLKELSGGGDAFKTVRGVSTSPNRERGASFGKGLVLRGLCGAGAGAPTASRELRRDPVSCQRPRR